MSEPIMVGGAGDGSRRRLAILLGVAGALLAGALVLPGLLFGGDDDDGGDRTLPATRAPSATSTTVAPTAEPPVETFEVFSTKNPFTPLVDTGGGAAPPGDGGAAPPPRSPGGGAGTPTTQPGEAGTTTTTEPGGGTEPPRPTQRIALLEVFTGSDGRVVASVRVNDTVHTVGEGDRFATSYQVVALSLEEGCGDFLFGDDRFRMCEGEELLK